MRLLLNSISSCFRVFSKYWAPCREQGLKNSDQNDRPLLDDGGTKGPERGAEARSAGAPRVVWSGNAVASPHYGIWGYAPRNFFQKINPEIAYFSLFLQAEIVCFYDHLIGPKYSVSICPFCSLHLSCFQS